eukprot:m.180681 g.180681  ORF g.180681 m.180681 type:complete len:295 (-) comp16861_c0_seq2:64-948(-)
MFGLTMSRNGRVAARQLSNTCRSVYFRFSSTFHATKIPLLENSHPAPFPGVSGQIEVLEPRHKLLIRQLQSQQRPSVGIVSYLSDHHLNQTSYRSHLVGTLIRPTIIAYNREKEDERAYPLVSYTASYRFRAHNLERDPYGNWSADLERFSDDPITPLELKKADMLAQVLMSLFETYLDIKCDRQDDIAAFQRRLEYMRAQGLAPFSFWAAKQISVMVENAASADTALWLQTILESRDLTTRLEELSNKLQPVVEAEAEILKTQERLEGLQLLAMQGGQEAATSKLWDQTDNVK